MLDLDNLLGDFIELAENNKVNDGIWREQPLDCLSFFTELLGETPYPGKQTELLDTFNQIIWWKMTGEGDLCEEQYREVTEMVIMLGKGSGKDFMASGMLAYQIYLICCMNDPHKYFGFGQDEPIDFINVAINAYQANNVYFKKLKARFNNCSWFTRVSVEPTQPNQFQLLKNQIRFYKGITAHSAHSEADSFEGFNPLLCIYDEIAGFEYEAAEDAYATLRSSASSRYNEKMLHVFISFPRHEEDFMMAKFKEATEKKDPEVYAMIGKSWEVNPRIKRSTLEKDYIRDPEGKLLPLVIVMLQANREYAGNSLEPYSPKWNSSKDWTISRDSLYGSPQRLPIGNSLS